MSLFNKTLILSVFVHLLVLVFFALFVPSKVVTYVQVPVEVVSLPPPPDIIGEKQVSPPEVPAPVADRKERVRVYLPDAPDQIVSEIIGYEGGVVRMEATPRLAPEDLPQTAAGLPLPSPLLRMPFGLPGVEGVALRGPARERGILYAPLPQYPDWAKEQGLEAYLELQLWINADGRVTEVSVLKSSGYPELDRRCVERVRQWRFDPAEEDITWAVLPLRFHLL